VLEHYKSNIASTNTGRLFAHGAPFRVEFFKDPAKPHRTRRPKPGYVSQRGVLMGSVSDVDDSRWVPSSTVGADGLIVFTPESINNGHARHEDGDGIYNPLKPHTGFARLLGGYASAGGTSTMRFYPMFNSQTYLRTASHVSSTATQPGIVVELTMGSSDSNSSLTVKKRIGATSSAIPSEDIVDGNPVLLNWVQDAPAAEFRMGHWIRWDLLNDISNGEVPLVRISLFGADTSPTNRTSISHYGWGGANRNLSVTFRWSWAGAFMELDWLRSGANMPTGTQFGIAGLVYYQEEPT
jgi:hypothetical protein